MFTENPIMSMLGRNEIPLGMQCFTGDTSLIEIMGLTGFDFVMIDCEHSGNNARALEDQIRASELAGLVPIVRVPDCTSELDIRRALEAGALGVFLPLVRTADDIKVAADAAFFPPKGRRGICPSTRASRFAFSTFEQYTEWNNAEILLVPMIERPEAVENIEEICALEEVKVLVFASGDLAYSMNEGVQMMRSPKVQEAYHTVLEACNRHGVAVVGGPVLDPNAEACRAAVEAGVRIFCLGLDTMGFRKFCEQTGAAMDAGLEGTGFKRRTTPHSGFPKR